MQEVWLDGWRHVYLSYAWARANYRKNTDVKIMWAIYLAASIMKSIYKCLLSVKIHCLKCLRENTSQLYHFLTDCRTKLIFVLECSTNPCSNGGTCVFDATSSGCYKCNCDTCYTGDNCAVESDRKYDYISLHGCAFVKYHIFHKGG